MTAASATVEEDTVNETVVEFLDDALSLLSQIDLRTVRAKDTRNEIKSARANLQSARKTLVSK